MTNVNKTDRDEELEKVIAIQAIKFGTVAYGSLLYWHYLTIVSSINN